MDTQKKNYSKYEKQDQLQQSTMNVQSYAGQKSKNINSFVNPVQQLKQNCSKNKHNFIKLIAQIDEFSPQANISPIQSEPSYNNQPQNPPKQLLKLQKCENPPQNPKQPKQRKQNLLYRTHDPHTLLQINPKQQVKVKRLSNCQHGLELQDEDQDLDGGKYIPNSLESYNDFMSREYQVRVIGEGDGDREGIGEAAEEQDKDMFQRNERRNMESILFNLSKNDKNSQNQKSAMKNTNKQHKLQVKIENKLTPNRKTFVSQQDCQSQQNQPYRLTKQKQQIFKPTPQPHPNPTPSINTEDISQNKCYLQIFQNKWQKVQLKILKSKIMIGPISIELQKILKIKIFPSQICEESKLQYEKIKKTQNSKKGQVQSKNVNKFKSFISERESKLYKSVDIGICRAIDMRDDMEDISLSDQNQNGKQTQYVKIFKKNLIKLTVQNDNIFQYYQRYPIIIPPTPKQTPFPSTLSPYPYPQPQTPTTPTRLPAPYLSLSRLILKKLTELYPKLKPTQWQPPSTPIRAVIQCGGAEYSPTLAKVKQKFGGGGGGGRLNARNYGFIHGWIYKKSQVKGKWEKRYVIVNQYGIYSYKGEKDQNYSFMIQGKNVKYMWTWFTVLRVDKSKDMDNGELSDKQDTSFAKKLVNQLKKDQKPKKPPQPQSQSKSPQSPQENPKSPTWSDQPFSPSPTPSHNPTHTPTTSPTDDDNNNSYLILKIKHGFNGQTQFGIPICAFDNEDNRGRNWLYAFYRLVSQGEG